MSGWIRNEIIASRFSSVVPRGRLRLIWPVATCGVFHLLRSAFPRSLYLLCQVENFGGTFQLKLGPSCAVFTRNKRGASVG